MKENEEGVITKSPDGAKSSLKEPQTAEKALDQGGILLNLIAEIIVEIIIRETNGRNRIYKKK